jgi:two-component system response regulator WspF
MRIAIVNPVPENVEILRRIIASVPGHTVAWTAADGLEAVDKYRRNPPDLILMELAMPVMDGVEATAAIMRENPVPILIVTESVEKSAAKVFEAMGCGALDAAQTPAAGPGTAIHGDRELLKKIATIQKLQRKIPSSAQAALEQKLAGLPPLVAIGSSTGGPKALANLLSSMPPDFGAAFVVVQHVDAQFAGGLAAWLDSQTPLRVETVRDGMQPVANTVLVAETGDHLVLGEDLALHYTPEPRDYPYRPSVNAFFQSLEKNWPRRDVAVLLTGMGRDGAQGLAALRRHGWHTIAQDEKTSIVYGMPAAAAELNAAVEILPIGRIAEAIRRRIESPGSDKQRKPSCPA